MSRISVSLFSAAALSLGLACASLPALAGDMDDKIEAREKTMKALGGGMKAAADYMKGEKELDDLKKATAGLVAAANRSAADVFPKGTERGVGDSHAKQEL
ncbi:MAG TPA: cytochrome c, partial [Azospirillaceae bacterium]|nr:cytochrome c [Azospirillaceae bacterium]